MALLATCRYARAAGFSLRGLEHMPGQVSSTALARYRLVDYSAPTMHAHAVMVLWIGSRSRSAPRSSPPSATLLCPRRRRLRPIALSFAAGDSKPGALDQAAPSSRMEARSGLRCCAPSPRSALMAARAASAEVQARCCACWRTFYGTPDVVRKRMRDAVPPAARDRLRRRQAPAAGPHREAAGASGSVALSAFAPALRRRHPQRRLRHPASAAGHG